MNSLYQKLSNNSQEDSLSLNSLSSFQTPFRHVDDDLGVIKPKAWPDLYNSLLDLDSVEIDLQKVVHGGRINFNVRLLV